MVLIRSSTARKIFRSSMEIIVESQVNGSQISCSFGRCIFHQLLGKVDRRETIVEYIEGKSSITLKLPSSSSINTVSFSHTNNCPAYQMELEKKEDVRKEIKIEKEGKVDLETNKIRVAVCVIARKSNGDVLLSQRSKKLRTFPSVWVFPGGSLDEGEDLLSAGLRELLEETGIKGDKEHARLVAIWESSYPISLSLGPLKRQHLVFYYLIDVKDEDVKLVIQPNEISRLSWLTKRNIDILSRKVEFVDEKISCLNGSEIDDKSDWYEKVDESFFKFESIQLSVINDHLAEGNRYAMKFIES